MIGTEHGIIIKHHTDTWSVIDIIIIAGQAFFLMENDEFGDETEALVLNEKGEVVCEEIYDDWVNQLIDQLDDAGE